MRAFALSYCICFVLFGSQSLRGLFFSEEAKEDDSNLERWMGSLEVWREGAVVGMYYMRE